jgi:lipid-A-disaccharide synthase
VSADEAPRIALVAGEASGDVLGAGLMQALRQQLPQAQFRGMTGPLMRAADCTSIADCEEIAVMGLVEVVSHLPRLLRLRARLVREIAEWQPHVFIGIDAPDFNLGLAKRLRAKHGIATVQYVSPQFWAWRSGRVKRIHRSVDHVLCLLPFEADFYHQHGVAATFTGHPLADRIAIVNDRAAARARLGIARDLPLVAILPGSRRGEVRRLGPDLIGAMALLHERRPDLGFAAAMANARVRAEFEAQLGLAPAAAMPRIALYDGRSSDVLAAADVVLLASGTATLETLLIKRPMVVCYRVAPASAWIARRLKLMTTERFSMPNLLAGREVVPELMQEAVSASALAEAVLMQLQAPDAQRKALTETFTQIHHALRRGANERAAGAVLGLLDRGAVTAGAGGGGGRRHGDG